MEHAEHLPTVGDLLWPAFNFTLFVALLVRGLAGPLREYFRARADRLREELAAGDRARTAAETLRAGIAKDLAELPATCARIKADLRATAERQHEGLLAQARQAADRIRVDARLLAEQEVAAARRSLRGEFVDATIREAAGLVRAATQASDQDRFVRDFVDGARASS